MDSSKELIIITGVSGAGKSSAMAFMEDAGYYCIDNMPPELMSTFVSLLANNSEYYPKVAMVVDISLSGRMCKIAERTKKRIKYYNGDINSE